MTAYLLRRLLLFIPLLIILSIVAFVIIQLPPGDFLTMYVDQLSRMGTIVTEAEIARLEKQYGLDKPLYSQYFIWLKNIILHGDFGRSFQWNKPVNELIGERLKMSVIISFFTLIFSWIIGVIIGIYSATHQYSIYDYIFTFLGFIGLSIPGFLLALIFIWLAYSHFGLYVGGLFFFCFCRCPMEFGKSSRSS